MSEQVLRLLFKIPDPITIREFCHRTGKSESSVRKLVDRRRLPIRTERQLNGEGFSDMRLMIMWNEWLEMIYDVNEKIPSTERMGWKSSWFKRINKLREDLKVVPDEFQSMSEILENT
ncbi:hypothetical protein [Xenorhabdus cabanillasii]|uniref:Regulatory protein Cox n=1 Tax=Xenorhabdus cabanillasii JM26 TaxID=1427517 RepID=W1J1G3_9GAMM|nr:hypothetical protein [Xenorhabdus cabanillasii]PHM74452.1 hypothetical protein Xcab_04307 [Xenorhabdus cabanillasii JM26]CDL84582.1 putative regulatory protein Cox [Xenorhabdus cabanillasii JM26]